jgi:hypothetical protein
MPYEKTLIYNLFDISDYTDIKNKSVTSFLTGIKKPATGGGFTGSVDGDYDINDYDNSQYKV